jgi:hypothetical protein
MMEDGSNWGVGGTKYLRHRQHQTVKQPTNRHYVDNVCDWVLNSSEAALEFESKKSANCIYMDAWTVIFGTESALKLLHNVRDHNWLWNTGTDWSPK